MRETVRKLYDKSNPFFKDRNKRIVVWSDVAVADGLSDGKFWGTIPLNM